MTLEIDWCTWVFNKSQSERVFIMEKKNTLLGSSPTIEGIQNIISHFYYSKPENFGIIFFTDKLAHVCNKKGKIEGVVVAKKGNRYRFESLSK